MVDTDSDDLFGEALKDYYDQKSRGPLIIHNRYGAPEEYPLDGFFFDEGDFTELESYALSLCEGRILDVGAAAGRHVLALQGIEKDVSALDLSASCCTLMKLRGVRTVIQADIFDYAVPQQFDTVFLLMNGIGLVGTLNGLEVFLRDMKSVVAPGGRLIFDSSDIKYLYADPDLRSESYYGSLEMCYEYNGRKGKWFTWLYIDQETLMKVAWTGGWQAQIIYEDQYDQFLARLTRI